MVGSFREEMHSEHNWVKAQWLKKSTTSANIIIFIIHYFIYFFLRRQIHKNNVLDLFWEGYFFLQNVEAAPQQQMMKHCWSHEHVRSDWSCTI